MDDVLEGAPSLSRRLLRALNGPGILLGFRQAGDSWPLAWQHTHLWVWGLTPAPSKRSASARSTH